MTPATEAAAPRPPSTDRDASLDALVRGMYVLGAVRRDTVRRALGARVVPGLTTLAALHQHGPLRPSRLAETMHVDLSVASRQIAHLEASGHVARTPDPLDRRSQIAALTDGGRAVLAEAHERIVAALGDAVGGWETTEVATLAALLERLGDDHARAAEAA